VVLPLLLLMRMNTGHGNARLHHLNLLRQRLVCSVRSRRQKRSKLKELNASCIWRITPTPSPSPERSASPAANGDAARRAAPHQLQLCRPVWHASVACSGSNCQQARLAAVQNEADLSRCAAAGRGGSRRAGQRGTAAATQRRSGGSGSRSSGGHEAPRWMPRLLPPACRTPHCQLLRCSGSAVGHGSCCCILCRQAPRLNAGGNRLALVLLETPAPCCGCLDGRRADRFLSWPHRLPPWLRMARLLAA
jgi:hypothetical protein